MLKVDAKLLNDLLVGGMLLFQQYRAARAAAQAAGDPTVDGVVLSDDELIRLFKADSADAEAEIRRLLDKYPRPTD